MQREIAVVPPQQRCAAGCPIGGDRVEGSARDDGRGPTAGQIRRLERPRTTVVVVAGDPPHLHPSFGQAQLRLTGAAADAAARSMPGQLLAVGLAADPELVGERVLAGPVDADTPDGARLLASVRSLDGSARPEWVDVKVLQWALEAAAGADVGDGPDGPAGPASPSNIRLDRQDADAVTIDGACTRDRDDAIVACRDGNDLLVEVHIADVAAHLPECGPLDLRARTLGTSLYLPGATVPMLPKRLSEGSLSLTEATPRDTVAVAFRVGPDGRTGRVRVYRSRTRVAANLTYAEVEAHLQGRQRLSSTVAATVDAADEAARRLGVRRDRRQTVEGLFDRSEQEIGLDGAGAPTLAHSPDHDAAERLVERLMVAANEAVAGWLHRRNAPCLYRVHDGVKESARERLLAAAGRAGIDLDDLDAGSVAAAGRRSPMVATVAAGSLGHAAYRTAPDHHYGLDAQPYLHFTSPIRRYADLVVHRAVAAELDGGPQLSREYLGELAGWLSQRSAEAARAEAMARTALWGIWLTGQLAQGGEVGGQARVSRLSPSGLSVRMEGLGVAGFVPARRLGKRRLAVSADGLCARDAQIRVGDRIEVRLAEMQDSRPLFCPT